MIKKLVWVGVLVAAVFAGREAWDRLQAGYGEKATRDRVEAVLAAAAAGDEQSALCAWAEGKVVLPAESISGYYDGYRRFAGAAGLRRGVRFRVLEVQASSRPPLVVVEVDGSRRRILVPEREPLRLAH